MGFLSSFHGLPLGIILVALGGGFVFLCKKFKEKKAIEKRGGVKNEEL